MTFSEYLTAHIGTISKMTDIIKANFETFPHVNTNEISTADVIAVCTVLNDQNVLSAAEFQQIKDKLPQLVYFFFLGGDNRTLSNCFN